MTNQTTTPSGADVDVLTVFDDCISKLEYHYRDTKAGAEMTQARTAVAALIARNAELEAERVEIRELSEFLVGSLLRKEIARTAERDALAAENMALREALELLSSPSCSMTTHGATSYIGWQAGDGLSAQQRAEIGRAALARTPAATTKGNDK